MSKLQDLKNFVADDDRDGTPIFAGRTREIDSVAEDLRRRLRNWRSGNLDAFDSATRLLQGAPGAGKTATLKYLEATLPTRIEGLRVCQLGSKRLEDSAYWSEKIGSALAPEKWAEFAESAERRYGLSVGAEGAGTVKGEVSNRRFPVPQPWLALARFVREAASEKPKWWRRLRHRKKDKAHFRGIHPVILLIDEIQNVPGGKDGAAAAFLCDIHESVDGLPIFPLYGGLAHSEGCLRSLGISRPGRFGGGKNVPQKVMTLDPLPESEVRAVCARFFDYFEISGDARLKERWTDAVVRESLGWPHHLHTHLQALGLALLVPGRERDLNALERVGGKALAEVGENAAWSRDQHYAERLEHPDLKGGSSLAALGATFVARSEHPIKIKSLGRELEALSDRHGPGVPDMELPEGMNGAAFAEAMLEAGILHKGALGPDVLSVPIPSFADYLRRKYDLGDAPSQESPLEDALSGATSEEEKSSDATEVESEARPAALSGSPPSA